MSMTLERADFSWIDYAEDMRFVMDDYGYPVAIPFRAPALAIADFEDI